MSCDCGKKLTGNYKKCYECNMKKLKSGNRCKMCNKPSGDYDICYNCKFCYSCVVCGKKSQSQNRHELCFQCNEIAKDEYVYGDNEYNIFSNIYSSYRSCDNVEKCKKCERYKSSIYDNCYQCDAPVSVQSHNERLKKYLRKRFNILYEDYDIMLFKLNDTNIKIKFGDNGCDIYNGCSRDKKEIRYRHFYIMDYNKEIYNYFERNDKCDCHYCYKNKHFIKYTIERNLIMKLNFQERYNYNNWFLDNFSLVSSFIQNGNLIMAAFEQIKTNNNILIKNIGFKYFNI